MNSTITTIHLIRQAAQAELEGGAMHRMTLAWALALALTAGCATRNQSAIGNATYKASGMAPGHMTNQDVITQTARIAALPSTHVVSMHLETSNRKGTTKGFVTNGYGLPSLDMSLAVDPVTGLAYGALDSARLMRQSGQGLPPVSGSQASELAEAKKELAELEKIVCLQQNPDNDETKVCDD